MAAPTVINGKIPAWSSLEFSIIRDGAAEEIITPIRALDYSDGSSPVVVMGAGYYPLGVSEGQYVPGSMAVTFLARFARQLMRRITSNGAVPLSSVSCRFVVKQRLRGEDEIDTDEIDFHFTEASDSRAQGTGDPNETQLACLPILIRRNGVVI